MLSARAGEEARVEGLESGADDYLVKPFTAQELIARVDSHIRMAQFRREAWERELELQQAVQRERNLAAEALEHISDGFWTYDSEWRIRYMNPAAEAMSQRPRGEQIGRTLWELFPDVVGTELERQFQRAMTNHQMTEFEWIYEPWQRWFRHRIYPTPDGGVAVYVRDSTEARLTEQALRRAEQLSAAGKLAASIAHEINNPLEAVTNLLFLRPPRTRVIAGDEKASANRRWGIAKTLPHRAHKLKFLSAIEFTFIGLNQGSCSTRC